MPDCEKGAEIRTITANTTLWPGKKTDPEKHPFIKQRACSSGPDSGTLGKIQALRRRDRYPVSDPGYRKKTFSLQIFLPRRSTLVTMRIRSVIFLLVFSFGLVPLFILVALTLPKTIDRLDRAAELESQALSQVRFARLNARIRCLKKSLVRSATLPSVTRELTSGISSDVVPALLLRWFGDDPQVLNLCLFDLRGRLHLSLSRRNDTLKPSVGEHTHHPRQMLLEEIPTMRPDEILARLVPRFGPDSLDTSEERFDLLMAAPVFGHARQPVGVMAMRVDLARFLDGYTSSFWVTGQGRLLHAGLHAAVGGSSCDAPSGFPVLTDSRNDNSPVIIRDGHGHRIAWLPIIFNERQKAVMWVGTAIDESATRQWKGFLLFTVLGLIAVMTVLVFVAASWIATRIDHIRKDLLTGLDAIINEEKKVRFNWQGPREIRELAADLTALAEHYFRNCEARNRAQAALRESEDKFRSLAGSALDGIILMDDQGKITYWNRAASTIFGYSDHEARHQPIHSLIGLQRREDEQALVIGATDPGGPQVQQTLELIAHHRDGREIPVEVSLSSARINDRWHAIWIVRDISERKKAEEQARKQQRQLQQADKMISLGLLVSGVAHEINNPNSIALRGIPMLARAWESVKPILDQYYEEHGDFTVAGLEYTEMRQQIPVLCDELEESAVRIRAIVQDLKDYARQESSGDMTELDVNEVVQAAVRLTANTVTKATRHFDCRCSSPLPRVRGNRQRLIQVVINLIQNSCEALRSQEEQIHVSTRFDPDRHGVEIRVEDTGAGIAPELISKVTDPFFTTKRTVGGTGLGLSVSAGIIKEHGGMIDFVSSPGQGTTVIVLLPCSETISATTGNRHE